MLLKTSSRLNRSCGSTVLTDKHERWARKLKSVALDLHMLAAAELAVGRHPRRLAEHRGAPDERGRRRDDRDTARERHGRRRCLASAPYGDIGHAPPIPALTRMTIYLPYPATSQYPGEYSRRGWCRAHSCMGSAYQRKCHREPHCRYFGGGSSGRVVCYEPDYLCTSCVVVAYRNSSISACTWSTAVCAEPVTHISESSERQTNECISRRGYSGAIRVLA